MNNELERLAEERNKEIQRALNQAKEQELIEKYDMVVSKVQELDPELESIYLSQVEEFERQWKDRKLTTVWEFLGKPEIKPIDGLRPEEMQRELDRVFAIMAEHSMHLDTINKIPIEELYAFVTGPFMQEEMNDMRIPGMMHGFIYEEFFPEKYSVDDSDWEGTGAVESEKDE
jgi:hypothetical protein